MKVDYATVIIATRRFDVKYEHELIKQTNTDPEYFHLKILEVYDMDQDPSRGVINSLGPEIVDAISSEIVETGVFT